MVNYSTVKEKLQIEVDKTNNNDLANLTHYFQNHLNGIAQHYQQPAIDYLYSLREHLNIMEDLQMQLYLPMRFDIPFPPPEPYDFTFIDLFAGIGGFRIPLQELKGKCVFTSEFNFHAQRAYEINFGEVPFGDITKLDLNIVPNHDVLTAGFPCQPFSISGKMRGFEDTRGTLIYSVFQIIEMRKPKVVFLENVKHLVHHDKGNTLRTIIKDLELLDYKVSWKVLNASNFGVAQNRERIVIIAHRSDYFDFSKLETKPKTILKDVLDKDVDFEYLNEPFTIIKDFKKQESGLVFIGYRNKKIRKAGVRPGTEHLSRVHKQPNRIYSTEGLHPALPSQESSGRFWIFDEGKVRKLTIAECYKIMGFPENFIKINNTSELYRQIGNSVCIPMIKEIAKQIKAQLL
ncbi:DNA cytosine methyltransferase [Mucilaginibacter arboris]|uniref:DNA cytosine methyltransferase n=1 Tax=Mucilaginibacter arboris TaxID=2682090 RepID=UPI0018DCD5F2|nr:DNA cytosine methyltransferase [Mucilaginibacter arboris]